MPEMRFHIRWPDGAVETCYSPSLVVKDFFSPGESYPLADFLQRSRTALDIASERVRGEIRLSLLPRHRPARSHRDRRPRLCRQCPMHGSPSTRSKNEHEEPLPWRNHHPSRATPSPSSAAARPVSRSASTSRKRGIDHVVLEKERAGHAWRAERWDTFCLVTPNWQCQLPGFPYRGPDPHGFMLRRRDRRLHRRVHRVVQSAAAGRRRRAGRSSATRSTASRSRRRMVSILPIRW